MPGSSQFLFKTCLRCGGDLYRTWTTRKRYTPWNCVQCGHQFIHENKKLVAVRREVDSKTNIFSEDNIQAANKD